jgi:hypothetical protein
MEGIHELWCSHMLKYYIARTKDQLLLYAIICMNVTNSMLTEEANEIVCDSTYIKFKYQYDLHMVIHPRTVVSLSVAYWEGTQRDILDSISFLFFFLKCILFIFCLFIYLLGLALWPRLDLNLWSSCLSLVSAGITGMYHCIYFEFYSWFSWWLEG